MGPTTDDKSRLTGPTIFMSCAEASGDHHASELIRSLRKLYPDARFVGAAGPKMQAEGCECIVDLTQQAAMLGSVFTKIFYFRQQVKKLQAAIAEIKPDVLVPVDSPALNWHLCRAAKKVDVPVMYCVAPQVWAWAPWRLKKVRKLTNHIACLLTFEKEYFRSRGVNATYVGHPLFDQLPPQRAAADCPDLAEAWMSGEWKIAMLPGSRAGEIAKLTRPLIETSRAIRAAWPKATITFTAVDEKAKERILAAAGDGADELSIVVGQTPEMLEIAHFAVAASGTVTLEVAHFGVPMVIVYNVGWLQKLLYRLFVRHLFCIKQLSLVNIVAGRGVVPELMPWIPSQQVLNETVLRELDDYGTLSHTRKTLLATTAPLMVPPPRKASDNIADLVAGLIEK